MEPASRGSGHVFSLWGTGSGEAVSVDAQQRASERTYPNPPEPPKDRSDSPVSWAMRYSADSQGTFTQKSTISPGHRWVTAPALPMVTVRKHFLSRSGAAADHRRSTRHRIRLAGLTVRPDRPRAPLVEHGLGAAGLRRNRRRGNTRTGSTTGTLGATAPSNRRSVTDRRSRFAPVHL